jgi:SAM-dependent methyltransferase
VAVYHRGKQIEYYKSKPASEDKMWCAEMASVEDFCVGQGMDPGAGLRTFSNTIIRCDIDVAHEPDHVCSADDLTLFDDNAFDFVINSHLLEHLPDPRRAILEWLRVVKPGGYVCMIIPNTIRTQGNNTDPTPHLWEWAPNDFVEQVLLKPATPWMDATGKLSWAHAEIVRLGEACQNWSICCVLRKCE